LPADAIRVRLYPAKIDQQTLDAVGFEVEIETNVLRGGLSGRTT
jgi:hypothetical protein